MGELETLPEGDDLLPDILRRRLSRTRVIDGVDDRAGTEAAEQLLVPALRTVLLGVGDELHQRGRQRARVAREVGASGVSSGFARANHEELNQLGHLTGQPEDDVHQDVRHDRRQDRSAGTDAEQVLEPVQRANPGANALVGDEEEDRRKHSDRRVDADVVVGDVAQLVSEDGFDLGVGHAALEETFSGSNDSARMDGAGRKGVRHRIRRDVDRGLVLEAALGEHAIDDVDQVLVNGVVRVSRDRLGHGDGDLGTEPPHNDGQKQPERAEAELELVGEVEDPEGAVDQAAHGKESRDRLQPRLPETVLNVGIPRVIMRNYSMTSHKCAPS